MTYVLLSIEDFILDSVARKYIFTIAYRPLQDIAIQGPLCYTNIIVSEVIKSLKACVYDSALG